MEWFDIYVDGRTMINVPNIGSNGGTSGFRSIPPVPPVPIRTATVSMALKAQRAFLMCKPDAVSRGLALDIMRAVSAKLAERGIPHRIVAPKLFNITPDIAKAFYPELKDELFARVAPYITGSHPDSRVYQAPVVPFIVEAYCDDLISILRSDDFIGPTKIDGKVLSADPTRTEKLKKSIRYKFTVERNIAQIPFEHGPLMNCVHCSGNASDALREIGIIYSQDELKEYYEPSALDAVFQRTDDPIAHLRGNTLSLPLRDLAGMEPVSFEKALSRLLNRGNYRDFSAKNMDDVRGLAAAMATSLVEMSRSFAAFPV